MSHFGRAAARFGVRRRAKGFSLSSISRSSSHLLTIPFRLQLLRRTSRASWYGEIFRVCSCLAFWLRWRRDFFQGLAGQISVDDVVSNIGETDYAYQTFILIDNRQAA